MTEQEVIKWMEERLDGTNAERSALGMIMADVEEHGFDSFLDIPPETVIADYISVSDKVTQEVVDDFKAMFEQEQQLDSWGVEQSLRLNAPASLAAMRDGMTDIMQSLFHYIETQRMANTLIEHED